ncbi:MAG: hypothetical protein CMO44_11380 [Verrucomicrobiales bacterium]|nr:hypothetical protein [Verrucomicrobiales bacterium]|tara:strand:+ start:644 stop:1024 length:381 start_codon:yes stop_codon:yes gene_type:complete
MFIEINNANKTEETLINEALWFAKSKLLPRHKNLDIEINLKKKLDVDGNVIDGDYKRHFIMEVRKSQDKDDLLTTIFHEFTHIAQYVRGNDIFALDHCDVDYLDRWFEIEAFEMQEKLLTEFDLER